LNAGSGHVAFQGWNVVEARAEKNTIATFHKDCARC